MKTSSLERRPASRDAITRSKTTRLRRAFAAEIRRASAALGALALTVFAPMTARALPLAQWQFDEMATGDAQTTAWDKTTHFADLELRKGSTVADLHSTTGTGPSGLPGDRSFVANLYTLPGAPSGYNGHGRLLNPQSDAAWQNLNQVTFCGWLKVDAVPAAGSQRLLDWVGTERVQLWFPWSAGELGLAVGDTARFAAPGLITSADVGKWVFIAVSYTGGQGINGVKFYRGTPATGVTLFHQAGDTTVTGAIQNTGAGDLFLGNNATANRNFPGQIDDFRIYGAALGIEKLEAIRRSALTPKECLMNPDFELRVGAGWTALDWWHVRDASTYNYVFDTVNPHSGLASQRVEVPTIPAGGFHIFKQDVQLRAGQTYEASVWVRSTATNPVRARFYLRKAAAHYDTYAVRTVTLNGNWQKLTIRGGTTFENSTAFFGLNILTPGTLWVDDASLIEVADAPNIRQTLTPTAVPSSFFGVHLNKLGSHNNWPAMGQNTLRLWDSGTRWGDLQQDKSDGSNPTRAWTWSRFDYYLKHAYGKTSNPTLIYTFGIPPKWAVAAGSHTIHVGDPAPAGYDISTAPPVNDSDWINYVNNVARRIPDNNAANAHMKIRHWELWNEVNVTGASPFYSGSVGRMVQLASLARSTLRAVDLNNKVLSPNITTSGLIWLEDYLNAGGGPHVDIYSVHAYNEDMPEWDRPFFAAVKDILSRYPGEAAKPIWNTEGAARPKIVLSATEQAGIVARDFITQWVTGISNFNWYAWDIHHGPEGVNLGATETGTPVTLTAGGIAYRETANWLTGASVIAKTVTPSPTGGERWIVEITRPGTYKGWIVWDSGGEVGWTVPATWGVTQVRRLDGSAPSGISGGASLTIGRAPVLLQKP